MEFEARIAALSASCCDYTGRQKAFKLMHRQMISEPLAEPTPSWAIASSPDSPIFIVGLSRSGTTLLSRMLDAHSEIAIFPETWWWTSLDRLGCTSEFSNRWQSSLFLNEVWKNLRQYPDPAAHVVAREASKQPRYTGPTAPLLRTLGQAYAKQRNARIWGEKTPAHALWLEQIKDLFPQARVLFMVRDPRDVMVSYDDRWNRARRNTEYLTAVAALLKYYLFHLFERPGFPPDQVLWVKYETLTTQPAVELQRICEFIEVQFEPAMLNFYHRQKNVESDTPDGRHHRLLSSPATPDHIGRYKKALTASQIALAELLLSQEMQALGYPLSDSSAVLFTSEETKCLEKAKRYYAQMISGSVRKKLRKRGMLKVRAYQMFGRVFDLIPSLRVPASDRDWSSLAE